MTQRNILTVIALLILTGLSVWVVISEVEYTYPPESDAAINTEQPPWWASLLIWQGDQQRSIRVHQGLDLQGGLQVVLQADLPQGQELGDGAMEAARIVVDNRVNALGVTEPLVQLQGEDRMIVELPGISDPDLAIRTLKETGLLEFVDAGPAPIPAGTRIQTSLSDEPVEGEEGEVAPDAVYETIITGSSLDRVEAARFDPNTRSIDIPFTLTSDGGQVFGQYSGSNIGNFLCIVLDKVVVSCPTIRAQITTQGTISLGNNDSLEEAQALSIQLQYGALPIPLEVVENRTVGPTLGQDSVAKSIRAGTLGLIVVLLFMVVYYRLPGFIAALALIIYGLLNFAVYKLIPVTLTLPAITGFILSVGMAVDANILVFERLKEELRSGRNMKLALEFSFRRSWPSIRDSAVSTIITCAILFWFGTNFGASIVKGFAITLFIGVVLNLFTAMTVTRAFMRFVFGITGAGVKDNAVLMGFSMLGSERSAPSWMSAIFNIAGYRRSYYLLSALLIIPGLIGMGISVAQFGSPLKPSIDFVGGTLMELNFDQPVQPGQVLTIFEDFAFDEVDFNDTIVTTAEIAGEETILIRSKFLNDEAKLLVQENLRSELGNFEELRVDSVGPTIGGEVTQAGAYAVLAAAVAILLYLVFAFRSVPNAFRYGVAAVIAMFHDMLLTAGLFAIFGLIWGWEIDALFLTAILTVIGYSVHDTIIVFDRVRENLPRYRTEAYETVCNRSLLETLNRSLGTSLSTMFVVAAILFFGGATVNQFIATILIGVISGTYSSIFNAVPVLVSWKQGELGNFFRRITGRQPVEAPA